MFSARWVRPLIAAGVVAGLSVGVAFAAKSAKVKDAWGQEVTVQGYDSAKNPGSDWFVHDASRPQPPRPPEDQIKPNLDVKAPEGAVSIFDGKTLNANAKWKVEDGVATIQGGGLTSKEAFGSAHFHIEWAAPKEVKGSGQGRGNSGIIIMGMYEIQVLDSWKNATYPDGMAGSVYGQNPPKFNASVPPGEWNSYDIEWHAPKFDKEGKLVKPARVTVIWNGVKVQDNYELVGRVQHQNATKYQAHAEKLPLHIQDHANPVQFKNIWVKPIDE